MSNNKQVQNMPLNLNFDDPKAMKEFVNVVKNIWFKLNDIEKRLNDLEKRVFE